MVKYITAKDVMIITNNGNIIMEDNPSHATLVLLGGELRYQKGNMVGDFTLNNLSRVTAKKNFSGCSGICLDMGMTTELFNEANINAMMFERVTGESYILVDHTKLEKKNGFVSCPVEKITHIITDSEAPETIVEGFRKKGIDVYMVD
jgi:DeoR/GlpR family transcriptional regulator of sugar metabolism